MSLPKKINSALTHYVFVQTREAYNALEKEFLTAIAEARKGGLEEAASRVAAAKVRAATQSHPLAETYLRQAENQIRAIASPRPEPINEGCPHCHTDDRVSQNADGTWNCDNCHN